MRDLIRALYNVVAASLVAVTLLLAVAADVSAQPQVKSIKGFEFGMRPAEFIENAKTVMGSDVVITKYRPKSSESKWLGWQITACKGAPTFTVLGYGVDCVLLFTRGDVMFYLKAGVADQLSDFFGIHTYVNSRCDMVCTVEETFRQGADDVVVIGRTEHYDYIKLAKRPRINGRDI